MFSRFIPLAIFASIVSMVSTAVTLSGSYKITPQDYYGLSASALANNPPACGMPYNELNLARITAVEAMDTESTCNLCLKVVNSANLAKFVYVLAVDLGGAGLDLSIPAFDYIFGQSTDASFASWSTVDYSFCNGVYTPGKINPNQGVTADSSTTTTTVKNSSTTNTRTRMVTTTKVAATTKRATTIKRAITKDFTVRKAIHYRRKDLY